MFEKKDVRVYVVANGQVPFSNWLESLRDRQAAARIRVRIARIRLGNLGPYHSIGEGVSELILNFGPGYRVYFGQIGNQVILLLCGGDKSSQDQDIKEAKAYWTDYRRRPDETQQELS